jgi:hypothetical protein
VLGHYEVRGWVGLVPPYHTGALGAAVPVLRAARLGGETPAITASQVREHFSRLLRRPAPSPDRIVVEITRVLQRKEAAQLYHWHQATGGLPPRRPPPGTS